MIIQTTPCPDTAIIGQPEVFGDKRWLADYSSWQTLRHISDFSCELSYYTDNIGARTKIHGAFENSTMSDLSGLFVKLVFYRQKKSTQIAQSAVPERILSKGRPGIERTDQKYIHLHKPQRTQ
jgi:hypothetical protein